MGPLLAVKQLLPLLIATCGFRNCFAILQLGEASFAHAAGAMEEGPLNPIAGSKPITTSLQTGPGVEFGAVKLQTVDEAVTLRQKMAAR